jgi:hypothetical protein
LRSTQATIPGTAKGADPLRFFDTLGDALRRFPAPARDRPLLRQLARVGIGPGLHPSTEHLSADTRRGLRAALAAGAASIKAYEQRLFLQSASQRNGWLISSKTGSYGTDYAGRALVDVVGLGAPRPSLSMYPFAITDSNLHPLTGATRYVVHVAAKYLPFPARSFWSLTLYDGNGFLVPNRAGVYLVNNRSHVALNPDGSLDIYLQPTAPTNPVQRRNWLPSPAGRPFRLILRLYEPENISGIASGRTWQPPTVLPCLADGKSAAGVACAH